MPRLLTNAEVADMLGTTERHLRELRARRVIPFVKVGGLVRYRAADVEAWLNASTVEAAS